MKLYDVFALMEKHYTKTYINYPIPLKGALLAACENDAWEYFSTLKNINGALKKADNGEEIYECCESDTGMAKIVDRYYDFKMNQLACRDNDDDIFFYEVTATLERTHIYSNFLYDISNYLYEAYDENHAIDQAIEDLVSSPKFIWTDEENRIVLENFDSNGITDRDVCVGFKAVYIRESNTNTPNPSQTIQAPNIPICTFNGIKVYKKCGIFGSSSSGWNKELRITDWHGNGVKYDIRHWNSLTGEPGKGVALTKQELQCLKEVLSNDLKNRPTIKQYGVKKNFTAYDDSKIPAALIEHIATISSSGTTRVELNIMKWNRGMAKYDLRRWTLNNSPYDRRGIVLDRKEAGELLYYLKKELN